MRWYYTVQGIHTRVRVFMNGGNCGNLCFRNEEFTEVKTKTAGPYGHYAIEFINETPEPEVRRTGHTKLIAGQPNAPRMEEGNVF